MEKSSFVTEWVLNTVKEKYKDDIALVISHSTLRIDKEEKAMSYFVPITKRGEELACTFILEQVGYDIWAVSWERLEDFAQLAEYNITCLADAQILYARTEEDRKRFLALQARQQENLADRSKMRSCALEAYEQARKIYAEMLFAEGSDVRLGAGYVLDYLARAIAFTNSTYFKAAQTEQLQELAHMEHVPEGFASMYLNIIREKSGEGQKRKCHEVICMVRDFLLEASPEPETAAVCEEHNFQDLADWYGELSYTWLRLRHYAAYQDAVKVYMWGIYLQEELNQVCRDFGLGKMELMSVYDADNLEAFVSRADNLEGRMREIITEGGGKIREYANTEEFLNEIQKHREFLNEM